MKKKQAYADEDNELDDTSIYDEEGREDLVSDDEMSAEEEGFMRGYEEADEKEEESNEEGNEEE